MPGHAIAALTALKSSLQATAGGSGGLKSAQNDALSCRPLAIDPLVEGSGAIVEAFNPAFNARQLAQSLFGLQLGCEVQGFLWGFLKTSKYYTYVST